MKRERKGKEMEKRNVIFVIAGKVNEKGKLLLLYFDSYYGSVNYFLSLLLVITSILPLTKK